MKEENGTYYLEILLSGVDYEKPNMEQITEEYKDEHKVIDQIIRKNAVVNGDYLSVYAENKEIVYLDGLDIYMSAERIATAVEMADAGYYYKDSKAPLTNRNVLFNERNVYTYSKAKNDFYHTSKLTLNYVLNEYIEERQIKNIKLERVSNTELKNDAKSSFDNVVTLYN